MKEMNEDNVREAVDELEALMLFYGGEGELPDGAYMSSTRWFSSGMFIRFIKDAEGCRIEAGEAGRRSLMFLCKLEQGCIRWLEPAVKTRLGAECGFLLRDVLKSRHGSTGHFPGRLMATRLDTEWQPRARRAGANE